MAVTVKHLTRPSTAFTILLSVLVYFATLGGLPARTEITGFSVTGRITRVVRNKASIVILCSKPYWGIGVAPGYSAIVFWPANTELNMKIAAVAPMTMDGKKIGFDQLAVGQTISVQYSIMESYFSDMYCTARRIDGWTTAPTKSSTKGH
jgi:hypothetical protein